MRSEPTLWTDETNPQELRRRADDLARDGMIAMAAEFRDRAEWLEAICRRCGGEMQPGIAMGQTYTAGAPDFPADREGVTMSAGGPGVVIEARKCSACGHSVTPP